MAYFRHPLPTNLIILSFLLSLVMSVFTDLNPRIKAALKELGISRPTDAQARMIPPSLEGENLLLVAPTGIGKTEAAILPIFHNILESGPKGFHTLYITPLRALNRDMMKRMTWFGERLGITVGVRHGDTSQYDRRKQVLKPPQILITTPETFQIMMTGSRLKELLKNVRHVIVDEIHELAQDERGAQLSIGLERLKVLTGRDIQRIGLSATVGTPEKVADFLRGSSRKVRIINVARDKKMRVRVSSPEPIKGDEKLADIIQSDEDTAARMRFCSEQIKAHNSTLLFVNTRDSAEILGARFHLIDPDHPIGVHHGSLSRDIRIQMEDEFKSQMLNALICTSSLELGIDVGSADFTIQYNSPREVSRLVQRLGRSGHRIGEVSRGVIVTDTIDDIFESMVVARRALAGELEGTEIRSNPLVVLANQVVAHIMQMGDENTDKFYDIVKRAYPFRELDKDSYLDVMEQLADMRLIWLEGDEFRRSRNSRLHFFDNISMIPDERTFRVVDITTRKHIGKLDESFVVAYAEPTASLIVRGRPWQIVSIEEDTILVEPSMGLGTVPSWSGEDIPVPHAIAQEVGRLREKENYGDYPVMANGRKKAREFLASHKVKCPVPTHNVMTIEAQDRMVIINACFGTKINETLGKLVSALLMARLGESIAVRCDPYRVMLQLPRIVNIEIIKEIFTKTNPDTVTDILRMYLRNTAYLRWKFVYVAKKFGAIRKDADYRSINIEKVMGAFSGTPLMREAINKTVYENLDIPGAIQVIRDIQSGKISLEPSPLSPIGKEGMEQRMDMMMPSRPTHAILMALKKRLERERVIQVCMNCHAKSVRSVSSIPEKISCQSCGGVMVAIVRRNQMDRLKLLKKKDPNPEEKKDIRNLMKTASLISSHGKRAVLALAARGVGPGNTARIVSRLYQDEDEFLAAILDAEVKYARTKRFWD